MPHDAGGIQSNKPVIRTFPKCVGRSVHHVIEQDKPAVAKLMQFLDQSIAITELRCMITAAHEVPSSCTGIEERRNSIGL